MPASCSTEDNRNEEKAVEATSMIWFQRSEVFHHNFTSDERIKEAEFLQFAKMFKQRRLRLNYTIKEVAVEVRCSRTTIHRFESLQLSLSSMRKWMPLLQNWLLFAAKSNQVKRLVPCNMASQNMAAPSGFRQWEPTKDSEVLDSYKGPWRPWRPWSPGN